MEKAQEKAVAFGSFIGTALERSVEKLAESFIEMSRHTLEYADRINKASQETGIAAEKLSALAYAADLSDVSFETMVQGLGRMSKSMAGLTSESKEQQSVFGRLGVNVREAGGQLRPMEQVLGDIAEKFKNSKDGAGKMAASMEIFGKAAGPGLIPWLNQGRAGIHDLMLEAERFGVVISTDTARRAEEFNDNMKRLTSISQGLANELMADLLPALVQLSGDFVNAKRDSTGAHEAIGKVAFAIKSMLGSLLLAGPAFDKFTAFLQFVAGLPIGVLGAIIPGVKMSDAFQMVTDSLIAGHKAQDDWAASMGKVNRLLQDTPDLGIKFTGFKTPPKPDILGKTGGDDNASRIKSITQELERQVQAFWQSSEWAKLYEAQQLGADKADQDRIRTLIQYHEGLVRFRDDTQQTAKAMAEKTKGVLELNAALDILGREETLGQMSSRVHKAFQAADIEKESDNWAEFGRQVEELQKRMTELVNPIGSTHVALAMATAEQRGFNDEQRAGLLEMARQADSVEVFRARMTELHRASQEFARSFTSSLENAAFQFRGFGDLVKSLTRDLLQFFERMLLLKPLENWLSGAFSPGGNGGIGGLLKGIAGAAGALFGGAPAAAAKLATGNISGSGLDFGAITGWGGGLAGGGDVDVGRAFMVGESGPEMFVPRVPGTVVPNGALRSSGVTIVNHNDFRGVDPSAEARIARMLEANSEATIAAAVRAQRDLAYRGI